MPQQTAVEWYYQQTVIEGKTNYWELLEQAKQMEKEQIENAYNAGSKEIEQDKDNAAWYYFETYVKQQQ